MNETLLNNSRITPSGNGNDKNRPICIKPTSGHKWWAAIVMGMVFAILNSPAAYYITSYVSTSFGGMELIKGRGVTISGLLLHTFIFVIIVRIILW